MSLALTAATFVELPQLVFCFDVVGEYCSTLNVCHFILALGYCYVWDMVSQCYCTVSLELACSVA